MADEALFVLGLTRKVETPKLSSGSREPRPPRCLPGREGQQPRRDQEFIARMLTDWFIVVLLAFAGAPQFYALWVLIFGCCSDKKENA